MVPVTDTFYSGSQLSSKIKNLCLSIGGVYIDIDNAKGEYPDSIRNIGDIITMKLLTSNDSSLSFKVETLSSSFLQQNKLT